jgi:hypothetical protein
LAAENKHLLDKGDWSAAHDKPSKVLENRIAEIVSVRQEVASLKQELGEAHKRQEEVTTLKKELAETRGALATREPDVT